MPWLFPAFAELHRVLAPNSFCISFYGWPHADRFLMAFRKAGFRPVGHLTFPKRYTSSRGFLRCQHENAYLLAKGRPKEPEYTIGDVIDWTYSGNKVRPTQKPLPCLLPLIETFSAPGDLVLTPSQAPARHCWQPGHLAAAISASNLTLATTPSPSTGWVEGSNLLLWYSAGLTRAFQSGSEGEVSKLVRQRHFLPQRPPIRGHCYFGGW